MKKIKDVLVKTKSIDEIFIEMENTSNLKKDIWDIWQASKGAVNYQTNGFTLARMQYTVKWMLNRHPQFSKAAYFKYLDRNIN